MTTANPKMAAARSFVRSLNILLKFVRLYGFDHQRCAAQFQTAWDELRAAMSPGDQTGLLLGAAGSQLVLDGAPIEGAHSERSFALMLSTAGLASIQFLPKVSQEEFARFVRAFPTGNAKSSSLTEQLKSALANADGIRLNEVRFVAEDASMPENRLAALTAKTLGADTSQMNSWLNDPQKLLQLIAAAEGSRGGSVGGGGGAGGETGGGGGTGLGPGQTGGVDGGAGISGFGHGLEPGTGGAGSQGAASRAGATSAGQAGAAASGGPPGTGTMNASGPNESDPRDEEILHVLRLLSHIGKSTGGGEGSGFGPGGLLQKELEKLPDHPRSLLRQALMNLGAQAPNVQSNDPMLLRLAEHLAIRFALDRYERGEVRVDAVRQMLDRMSQEITALREILGSHEEKMAGVGIMVESHADLMDRQFWAAVPEAGKRAVLTSPDAWCIPPRNVRQYVEELRRKGDEASASSVLENYASGVKSEEAAARRRIAIGLSELADLYAAQVELLVSAIRHAGLQLTIEREDELQGLISAAFVRLAQEAGSKRLYRAVLQSLDSLDGIELQRPSFVRGVRPRLGFEKRLPEFVEEALRPASMPVGLLDVLKRLPVLVAECLMGRFNRTASAADCKRIAELAQRVGSDVTACLREALQVGQPAEAAEGVGLLSRLDAPAVEKWLGNRLRDWPRPQQDRALRLLASGGAPERGWLILSVLDEFDVILQPLAVDEIGMSGEPSAETRLTQLASGMLPTGAGPYLRLKAIEALGRLNSTAATGLLREIVKSKKLWRWQYPSELRLAALQALLAIAPASTKDYLPDSGFSEDDLALTPRAFSPKSLWLRQRRYPRIRLKATIPATATSARDTIALEARGLSLSGGVATGGKHLSPGTLVSLRLGSGLRPIRAQAIMRDARAQGLSFEFADMDLEERARLRDLLRRNGTGVADELAEDELSDELVTQERR
jgi:hypothetical protein